jgi:rubrerythrin
MFTHWKNHFIANKSHFEHINWDRNAALTEEEWLTIAPSIQQFQKGENSEGKSLIGAADQACQQNGDYSYSDAIRYFIAEENSHAAALGKFMARYGIPKISDHWSDTIFRAIRKGKNLERAISTLVTAEFVAMTYYEALRDATNNPILNEICTQILKDEVYHLQFQSEAIQQQQTHSTRLWTAIKAELHFAFCLGTLAVVWFNQRNVYKKGGFSFLCSTGTHYYCYFNFESYFK